MVRNPNVVEEHHKDTFTKHYNHRFNLLHVIGGNGDHRMVNAFSSRSLVILPKNEQTFHSSLSLFGVSAKLQTALHAAKMHQRLETPKETHTSKTKHSYSITSHI